jgi:hypothetical protein
VSEESFTFVFMVESRQRGATLTVFRGVCVKRTRPLLISTPGGSYVQLRHVFNMKFGCVQFCVKKSLVAPRHFHFIPAAECHVTIFPQPLSFRNATKREPFLH